MKSFYHFKDFTVLRPLYLLYKTAVSNRYTIGVMEFEDRIVEPDCDNSSLKFHWIVDNHKRGWFADPFILFMNDDEIVFLVEEYIYKLKRGVISKLVIDRKDYSIKDVEIILDTGSHLSFPAYYMKGGKIFIYPESGQRGGTYLYEYNVEGGCINELYKINPNITADTILVEMPESFHGGGLFQFCTTSPTCDKNILDIYPFYEKECSKVMNPVERVHMDRMTARNAGNVFKVKDKLYRPAQDCTNNYGECTEIQEIICDGGILKFKSVNRIYSSNKDYPDAFHTFNVFDNKWVAVDARKKRFPLFYKIIGFLVRFLGCLK